MTVAILNTIAATVARLEAVDADLQRRIVSFAGRSLRPLEVVKDALSLIPNGFSWGAGAGEGFWARLAPRAHAAEITTSPHLAFAITASALWAVVAARKKAA